MRTKTVILLVVFGVGLTVVTNQAQQPAVQLVTTSAEFGLATSSVRRATLQGLAAGRLPISDVETTAILNLALLSTDADVRRDGCDVIVGRAMVARTVATPDVSARWRQERSGFASLEGRLGVLLGSDEDERVRDAAVMALGNLQYDGGDKRGIGMVVSDRFVETLSAAYKKEDSTRVRVQIVKALALTDSTSPQQVDTLIAALVDVSPLVARHAVTGLARLNAMPALPKVVLLLDHEESIVRVAVAQALVGFGKPAKVYLPNLEKALVVERDQLTKRTIEGAIHALRALK